MVVLIVLVGLLAALAAGVVALLVAGEVVAGVVAVLVLAAIVYGVAFAPRGVKGALLAGLALVFVAAGGYAGYTGYTLYAAFSNTSGEVDRPDATAFASARAKLDAAENQAGFRLELTDRELTAVVQDALAEDTDHPIRSVTLRIVDGASSADGTLEFEARFKNSGLTASGAVGATLNAGAIEVKVQRVGLGAVKIPGVARGALEDLVETIVDLNKRLEEQRADVQVLEIGSGRVLVVGTQAGGELISLKSVMDGVRENVAALGASVVTPPAPRTSPGTVAGREQSGSRYYVAIGDSLAAAVGVSDPREGYVSRIHRALSEQGDGALGLRNFGISGETSGSLIRGGQLEEALAFLRANNVAYVTIDIGANDLLGHIYSPDCADSLEVAACQQRLAAVVAGYRDNLGRIIGEVKRASGSATVVFMGTYNPFSIGFGASVRREAQTDDVTMRLNAVAKEVAEANGVVYADGFAPMRGTAGATTHMLADTPDIHPQAIGYDILASAILDALK